MDGVREPSYYDPSLLYVAHADNFATARKIT